ncbi:PTS sugar transporter subunit IIA [Clostridium neuense]|uniref:PTS sugar transporter subunit IIA n=1 Tax=Clostridium neuense TaxID=1728934 RepID=A0ABW8TK00_9CLOT
MRRFLIATHGHFAEGIYSSLKMIIGNKDNVETLCAYVTKDYDLKANIRNILGKLNEDDELIVITDIFGGSVNNEFMNLIGKNNGKIHLIAGLNLPLLAELISRQDDDKSTEDIINEVLNTSKQSIQYCNETLNNSKEICDDEF